MLAQHNHTYYDIVRDSIDHVTYSTPVTGLETEPMVEAWANSDITSGIFIASIVLAIIATSTAKEYIFSSLKNYFNIIDRYALPRHNDTKHNIVGVIAYWLLSILGYTIYICINIDILTHQTTDITTYICLPTGLAMMGLFAGYFFIKFILLQIIGIIYQIHDKVRQLCKHYFFLLMLLGLISLIISFIEIYSNDIPHDILNNVFNISLGITVLATIIKSLRIFYRGINSLYYYLLYLCTLEILPVCLLAEVGKKWF